jgi:hypothetical protein
VGTNQANGLNSSIDNSAFTIIQPKAVGSKVTEYTSGNCRCTRCLLQQLQVLSASCILQPVNQRTPVVNLTAPRSSHLYCCLHISIDVMDAQWIAAPRENSEARPCQPSNCCSLSRWQLTAHELQRLINPVGLHVTIQRSISGQRLQMRLCSCWMPTPVTCLAHAAGSKASWLQRRG